MNLDTFESKLRVELEGYKVTVSSSTKRFRVLNISKSDRVIGFPFGVALIDNVKDEQIKRWADGVKRILSGESKCASGNEQSFINRLR